MVPNDAQLDLTGIGSFDEHYVFFEADRDDLVGGESAG
jgi:hypothetical protein